MRRFARNRRLLMAALAALLILALGGVYAGLAVYKAIDYTTTPHRPRPSSSPADLGLAFDDVEFPARGDADIQLRGWWVPADAARQAVILVHGRYADRSALLALAQPLYDAGFSVLLFDLRGHGSSTAAACSYGLRERWDIAGAVDYVLAQGYAPGSIGVLGWSLGGVRALLALPADEAIGAVVSDSAYADGGPLLAGNALRPGLRFALRLVRDVNLDELDVEQAMAARGDRPILLIHGAADRAVPLEHARRLERAGGDGVRLWVVEGAGHVGAWARDPDEYAGQVTAFFTTALASR